MFAQTATPGLFHIAELMMMQGMRAIWEIVSQPVVRLSEEERNIVEKNRLKYLGSFVTLSGLCMQGSIALFRLTPKLHRVWSCLRRAAHCGLSPQLSLCFKCEDAAGKAARICAGTHLSTMHLRTLERWPLSYFSDISSS